jgi:hypothetical protein
MHANAAKFPSAMKLQPFNTLSNKLAELSSKSEENSLAASKCCFHFCCYLSERFVEATENALEMLGVLANAQPGA